MARRMRRPRAGPGFQVDPSSVAILRMRAAEEEINRQRDEANQYLQGPFGQQGGLHLLPYAIQAATARMRTQAPQGGGSADMGKNLLTLSRLQKLYEDDQGLLSPEQREAIKRHASLLLEGIGGPSSQPSDGDGSYMDRLDPFLEEYERALGG